MKNRPNLCVCESTVSVAHFSEIIALMCLCSVCEEVCMNNINVESLSLVING